MPRQIGNPNKKMVLVPFEKYKQLSNTEKTFNNVTTQTDNVKLETFKYHCNNDVVDNNEAYTTPTGVDDTRHSVSVSTNSPKEVSTHMAVNSTQGSPEGGSTSAVELDDANYLNTLSGINQDVNDKDLSLSVKPEDREAIYQKLFEKDFSESGKRTRDKKGTQKTKRLVKKPLTIAKQKSKAVRWIKFSTKK